MIPARRWSTPKRRLPPFAQQVRAILDDPDRRRASFGAAPNGRLAQVHLVVGLHAWDRATRFMQARIPRLALLLPAGQDPASFDWSVCSHKHAGMPIVILSSSGTPIETLDALASAVLRDGCRRLWDVRLNLRFVARECDADAA